MTDRDFNKIGKARKDDIEYFVKYRQVEIEDLKKI